MVNKWVGNKPELAGHILRAEIRSPEADPTGGALIGFGWTSTTQVFRKGVPWLKGRRRGVIFAAREVGRAQGFDEDEFAKRLPDVEARAIAPGSLFGAMFLRGVWDSDEVLQIPDEICAHVLGDFRTTGFVWLWAHRGSLEIWSDAFRMTRISAANAAHVELTRLPPDGDPT